MHFYTAKIGEKYMTRKGEVMYFDGITVHGPSFLNETKDTLHIYQYMDGRVKRPNYGDHPNDIVRKIL
jgi:hypothetical protein